MLDGRVAPACIPMLSTDALLEGPGGAVREMWISCSVGSRPTVHYCLCCCRLSAFQPFILFFFYLACHLATLSTVVLESL